MDIAICTEDGVIYTAINFSYLPAADIARKRRLLRCPECSVAAFFRNSSPIGRGPCFGARPHAIGCGLAAQDFERLLYDADDQVPLYIPRGKIIVDLNYGAPEQQANSYCTDRAPTSRRNLRNSDWTDSPKHHRLGPLLRMLVGSPEFGNSNKPIEVAGFGEIAIRDFFVQLESATSLYSGQFKGYWGFIADAQFADDKSIWLNTGGRDNISFCIDSKFVDVIAKRYRINDLEDFAGAYILVLGTPHVSPNGKLHIIINGPEYIALRLR